MEEEEEELDDHDALPEAQAQTSSASAFSSLSIKGPSREDLSRPHQAVPSFKDLLLELDRAHARELHRETERLQWLNDALEKQVKFLRTQHAVSEGGNGYGSSLSFGCVEDILLERRPHDVLPVVVPQVDYSLIESPNLSRGRTPSESKEVDIDRRVSFNTKLSFKTASDKCLACDGLGCGKCRCQIQAELEADKSYPVMQSGTEEKLADHDASPSGTSRSSTPIQSSVNLIKWMRGKSKSVLSSLETREKLAGFREITLSWGMRPGSFRRAGSATLSGGVLSPVGKARLAWDLMAFVMLFFDIWLTPFALVFMVEFHEPVIFPVLEWIVTGFFCLDILLNFNTGYIERARIITNRGRIFRHYFSSWFWFDLIATLPYDEIFAASSGGVLSTVRFVKITRYLKTARFLKMVRMVKMIKQLSQVQRSENHIELFANLQHFFHIVLLFAFVFLVAHFQGCIWAVMQRDYLIIHDTSDAFEKYFESLTVIFCGIVSGRSVRANNMWLYGLDMIISTERLLFTISASAWAIFKAMVLFEDRARHNVMLRDAMKFLRRHKVTVKTQIQVHCALQEGGKAQQMQNSFNTIMKKDVPEEIHRKICEELWIKRLLKFELLFKLSDWSTSFLTDLAVICQENVFSTHTVLITKGELCLAVYHVLQGDVRVLGGVNEQVPDYKKGMWIGGQALVTRKTHHTSTAVALSLVAVMSVPCAGFWKLIDRLNLKDKYEDWCVQHLWEGICGRCGLLGDHFEQQCPFLEKDLFSKKGIISRVGTSHSGMTVPASGIPTNSTGSSTAATCGQSITAAMFNGSATSKLTHALFASSPATTVRRVASLGAGEFTRKLTNEAGHRNLTDFLNDNSLGGLGKIMGKLKVYNLEDLANLDTVELCRAAHDEEPPIDLTAEDLHKLTSHYIDKYCTKRQNEVRNLISWNIRSRQHHFIFISHYKKEAGTEAALLRSEMEQIVEAYSDHPSHDFNVPIFLDTENLNNVDELRAEVRVSHNVILLLTTGVLTRPWCLVEIVTAFELGIPVVPVQVDKVGNTFEIPDAKFFTAFENGLILDDGAVEILTSCGIDLARASIAIREVFKRIAVPYSPHRSANIRATELEEVLSKCIVRDKP